MLGSVAAAENLRLVLLKLSYFQMKNREDDDRKLIPKELDKDLLKN